MYKRILRKSALGLTLSAQDLQNTDHAADKIKVKGAHYPEALEAMTGR